MIDYTKDLKIAVYRRNKLPDEGIYNFDVTILEKPKNSQVFLFTPHKEVIEALGDGECIHSYEFLFKPLYYVVAFTAVNSYEDVISMLALVGFYYQELVHID